MYSLALLILLSSILWTFFHVLGSTSLARRFQKLPPGPFPIPIVGNIFQLGRNPHRSLANLSKTYGPLMNLKLGSVQTIVVSSPEMAKEILQKHDQSCCSRMVPYVAQALNHHEASMVWLPVGNKWRKLRKICKEHMVTREGLLEEKLQQLSNYLEECCLTSRVVDIGEVVFITSLNLISSILFSFDFARFSTDSAQEMREIIQKVTEIAGTPNLADFFPVLKVIDPHGLKGKTEIYFAKLLGVFDEIISKRLHEKDMFSYSGRKKDFLQVVLDVSSANDSDLSRHDIKHLLLDLILGADTTTDSVLWAISELFRNPNKMLKLKKEFKTIIGENKQIEQSDISKLPYLQAVIKETFRCHPAGPFLLPHKAQANVEINGFTIPKDAQILVNVWAIGRDSSIWLNPNSFEPERFLDCKIDYKGQDFELITFSSGRRICPGMPLAHQMVPLMVAYLIHNFDWKLEAGMKPEELDMDEVFGLSLHKAVPLRAFPVKQ